MFVLKLSKANVLLGAPRIHGELLKSGIDVSQSTIAKYLIKEVRSLSQAWKTIFTNHADGIAANNIARPRVM